VIAAPRAMMASHRPQLISTCVAMRRRSLKCNGAGQGRRCTDGSARLPVEPRPIASVASGYGEDDAADPPDGAPQRLLGLSWGLLRRCRVPIQEALTGHGIGEREREEAVARDDTDRLAGLGFRDVDERPPRALGRELCEAH